MLSARVEINAGRAQVAEDLQQLTAQIVAAYAANNSVSVNDLPSVIQGVYSALSRVGSETGDSAAAEPQAPAVPIKKSVKPDYITCLECGKQQKMLKRHLASDHDLTPDQYRAKWNLPREYPMTAPNYAEARSQLAKASGLGLQGGRTKGRAKKK